MLKDVLTKIIKAQGKDDIISDDVSLELKIYYLKFFNSLIDDLDRLPDLKGSVSSMYHNQHI